ncbi:hypothetical protein AAFF_G00046160 [Aldrovandia affinis]|uniref:Uncharacterized protein n=1 Tax=Aldrovandia affinis TaxID=143900 RepID=A0AAD7S1T9_9TELE|nr:hypothetical protein AAFF_G00046160 [Aldrovandia affinis]
MYIVFVGASSNHHCRIPENANITEAWREASIPTHTVNGELQYSKCSRYSLDEITKLSTLNSSPVEVNLTNIPQEGCVNGWAYDQSTFYSTIITEAFCPSWELFCVAYFCLGFSQISLTLSAFVLGTEVLSGTLRVLFSTLSSFLSYCTGYMLLPAIAFGLRHWRTLLLALSGLNILQLVPLWW